MLVCRRHMSYCQHLKAWRHTLTQAPPRTPGRMRHRDGGGDGDWGFNFKILVHYNNILFLSSLSHGSWLYHYLTHIWIWVTCHRCWAVKLNQDSSKKSRWRSNRCHPDVTHADVVSGPTSPRIRGYKVKGLVGWLSVTGVRNVTEMVHLQTVNYIFTFSLYLEARICLNMRVSKTWYVAGVVANVKGQCTTPMLVPVGRPSTPSVGGWHWRYPWM